MPKLPSSTPELLTFPRKRKDDTSNQLFCLNTQRLSQQENDFDMFGKNFASKLRILTSEQKIFALFNNVRQIKRLSINSQVNV